MTRGPSVPRRRHGVVLLEAVVALTIFATIASAVVLFAATSVRTVERARNAERVITAASAFVDDVALWTRTDLDRRLGSHTQGPWRLDISRPLPTVYVVRLADDSTARPLIVTAIYRPRPSDATP